ncbi:hypothetical protein RISK_004938 [Rhodopirellula islandica]|uniref:Cell division protein FtsH n=1 Tax=Rhodopirellula islandica TaxID=595434 RepID=A0A0J1B8W0_RHOIS|nr:hypothetical protein [Rhodopirellula islandica]KLU02968.1 hypothetical protein RISK_004938 [Rhodopirellula islandica]
MTTDHRWETAIHEAGHAVAAIVLGGKCTHAELTLDSGHVLLDELSPDDRAFAVSAGPAAEFLAGLHEPPPRPMGEMGQGSVDLGHLPEPHTSPETPAKEPSWFSPPDDVKVARWAIEGCEKEPERWASRVYFARHIAHKIIEDHRDEILTLASRLYLAGQLDQAEVLEAIFQTREAIER